ncbi:MAG TPA: TIGR03435 family protein [Bryobacteraceae bacterium]|nr:TIGR03435 family protein [Bryobacteraceae bacterium]
MKLAAALLLACICVFAQSEKLEFEAASLKPSAPPDGKMMFMNGGRGGPGSNDPTRITFTNATLAQFVTRAYNIKNYQLSAPDWLNQERFDLEAKIPTGATKEQANIMLQNLLAERFHMVVSHGTKEFQGYELVVAKGGPKLKQSSPEDAAYDQSQPRAFGPPPPPPPPGQPMKLDRPGLMVMMRISPKGMVSQMTARAQTMQQLIDAIANNLNRPVIDSTGLTNKYDFSLNFSAETPAGMPALPPPPPGVTAPSVDNPEDLAPALPAALPEQLGLRLQAKKIPLPTITVEKADKTPTAN